MTFRRLDGSLPGSTHALRLLYNKHRGLPVKYSKPIPPWRDPKLMKSNVSSKRLAEATKNLLIPSADEAGPSQTQQGTRLPPNVVDWANPCSFVFRKEFEDVARDNHVMFKFVLGCQTPRSVDGKTAWTTKKVETRMSRDVFVSFKTQESLRFREEFVPISSLELCPPGKTDRAVIVKGEDMGKVVYPSRIVRNDAKARTGMMCRMSENARGKKGEVFYANDSITRIVPHSQGPPAS